MSISQQEWTVEMLDALPDDGNRYEVIDGVLLVTPAPANVHQRAIGELYLLLAPYCRQVGLDVLFAPAAVRWSERLYRDEKVPEYWIVDPEGRTIDRWTPVSTGAERLSTELIWQPIPEHAPLIIDLAGYFRDVHG